jgi:hypothetical protein
MFMKIAIACVVAFCALAVLRLNAAEQKEGKSGASGATRYFEMRTYHANPGKMDALNKRFRDHTNRLFVKHGIDLVGYWEPVDQKDTLIYILAYPNKEARDTSWKAFQSDPDWIKAKADSEKDGVLVNKVDQVFMTPTDYSPIK